MALDPGRDYYLENGLMVLTAHYLTRRGYCCGNRCRHCPYGEKIQQMAIQSGAPVSATAPADDAGNQETD